MAFASLQRPGSEHTLGIAAGIGMIIGLYFLFQPKVEADRKFKCADFLTQGEAQYIYDSYIKNPYLAKYVKGLDGDGNKIVCESLPVTETYAARS